VVKNVPADDETVVMTVEPEPPLSAAFEDDGPAGELLPAAPVLLLPVLHAATSSAMPIALPRSGGQPGPPTSAWP